jgi:hypothetical protein
MAPRAADKPRFPRAIAGVIAASGADLSRRNPFAPERMASNREITWSLTSINATGLMLSFAPTGL